MRLIRLAPVLAGMLICGWGASAFAQTPTGAVTLQWTAPGDDSLTGTAARYDLRYSLFPITELNFPYCSGPGGLPHPATPGAIQRFTIYGLLPGLRYYFALKTADERLNWSKISNVVAFAEPTVGVDPDHPQLTFATPIPNPARTTTGFSFALPRPARVRVDIFDPQGRMIRTLYDEEHPAGTGLLTWDLRDLRGVPAPAGVYLVRARLGDATLVRRLLVVR